MRNGRVMLKRRRREEGREAKTDEELWSPGLTPVCGGGSPGSRRPLSCVWSRSLAGGRVEGG